ncbi:MAG: hypothetical protein WKG07_25420 [Hymenobacter sp.]
MRDIAAVIGRHLAVPVVAKTPEEAADYFGWMALFAGLNMPATSIRTQQELGWQPTHKACWRIWRRVAILSNELITRPRLQSRLSL